MKHQATLALATTAALAFPGAQGQSQLSEAQEQRQDLVQVQEQGPEQQQGQRAGQAQRKETFTLYPRNQPWASKRTPLGQARLLTTPTALQDFTLHLEPSNTHIQRTLRRPSGAPPTFVYREWRRTSQGAQAGRSLILESLPTPGQSLKQAKPKTALLREWAGGDIRHQDLKVPANGLTWLAWIEQERQNRTGTPRATTLSIFSDQECTWTPALVIRTNLPGALRTVDLLPRDGSRNARLVFAGETLVGFLEGNLEAVLTTTKTTLPAATTSHL